MILLILYVALALGVSFLCSIMEAVLLSVSPSYVAAASSGDSTTGERLRAYKEDIDRPLAAILSLNTIAHTVGAAGAGAQAASVFGSAYLGVASAVLTLLILIVSEIIPKTLGALYWRALVGPVVRILGPVIVSMWPLVKMAQWLTSLMARRRDRVTFRRDEFAALADAAVFEGVLRKEESHMMRSLLRFGKLLARDVMTPRTVIAHVDADATIGRLLSDRPDVRFSRLPVTRGDIDHPVGFVLRADLLAAAASGGADRRVESLVRPLVLVPETLSLHALFDRLMTRREHIALVVDEHGGTAGLVTLEDVLETLLGLEIVDEFDTERDMRVLARRRWRDRAREMGLDADLVDPPDAP